MSLPLTETMNIYVIVVTQYNDNSFGTSLGKIGMEIGV